MKRFITILIILGLFCGVVCGTTGLFVVQPIGSIPEGMTIWYMRSNLNLPFISSPDSISLEKTGSASLLRRGIILGEIGLLVLEKKILELPYMESIYLISTDG